MGWTPYQRTHQCPGGIRSHERKHRLSVHSFRRQPDLVDENPRTRMRLLCVANPLKGVHPQDVPTILVLMTHWLVTETCRNGNAAAPPPPT